MPDTADDAAGKQAAAPHKHARKRSSTPAPDAAIAVNAADLTELVDAVHDGDLEKAQAAAAKIQI